MRPLLLIVVLALASSACSVKRMGMSRMADALSATASSFASDDDPEFVRAAAPATLKMVEMLLDEQPKHPGLLLTACSGFTQYAYAFLQVDSELLQTSDAAAARELKGRAKRMYDRANGYCGRALILRHPHLAEGRADHTGALAGATAEDVPMLYWSAVAWGGSLSATTDMSNPLALLGGIGRVRELLTRAIELDEDWQGGALHEAMIAIEGLPALLGGSAARARTHYTRAVELSKGQSAFAHVAMASSVALPARDRAAFEKHLRDALAIDPSRTPSLRLANLIAQRQAKFLLSSADRLFR